jgi:NADH/F420H2 dehydrogenase subunit C
LISQFPGSADIPAPAAPFVRGGDEPQVKIPADKIAAAAEFLKAQEGFDLLSFVTAVDYIKENRFELVYYLMRSNEPKARLILKVDLPREGEPQVPSVAPVWKGADWQEREIYDLYGIRFDKHPNLKRILLWEGYQGYPLRKDYVHIQDKYDNGLLTLWSQNGKNTLKGFGVSIKGNKNGKKIRTLIPIENGLVSGINQIEQTVYIE